MNSKKKLLKNSRLYVILDKKICGKRIFKITRDAIKAGADIIQYRDKESSDRKFLNIAGKIQKVCKQNRIPFIINDRIDPAMSLDANGVHLGEDDLPVALAARLLKDKIIGVSCKSLKEARLLKNKNIDYFGCGSIFKTTTKKGAKQIGLASFKRISSLGIPTFALGGINKNNLNKLKKIGIHKVAICSAICKSKNSYKITRLIKSKLK